MKRMLCALAAALLLAPAAAAEGLSDQAFAEKAAHGNLMEIELGRLASEKAEDAQIQNFAERMVDGHREAQSQLEEAAQQQDIALPHGADDKAKQAAERLSGLSGAEFDRAYVKLMVEAHQKDVALYEQHAQDPDSPIQAYAADLRPILRKHREIAEKLARQEVQLQ